MGSGTVRRIIVDFHAQSERFPQFLLIGSASALCTNMADSRSRRQELVEPEAPQAAKAFCALSVEQPLEGAAQLGVVWLRGHGKDGCDPTSAKLALQLRATQLGGPQAGGAQLGGPHLDVGLID